MAKAKKTSTKTASSKTASSCVDIRNLKVEATRAINETNDHTNITFNILLGDQIIASSTVAIKEALCIYSGDCQ